MWRKTEEQVDKLDELTSRQVNCEERQSNKGTSGRGNKLIVEEDKVTGEQGVSTCNIWGREGLEKNKRLIHFLQEEFSFHLLSLLTLQVITL